MNGTEFVGQKGADAATRAAEYTPGPWIVCGRIIDSDCRREGRDILERICVLDEGPSEVEATANARLIAAAPDLAAASEALIHWSDDFGHLDVDWPGTLAEAVNSARAALVKVKQGQARV